LKLFIFKASIPSPRGGQCAANDRPL
jgi:hypothetical protein